MRFLRESVYADCERLTEYDIILKKEKCMKRLLALIAIMLPLSVSAQEVVSLDGLTEPEWKDFCPPTFADAEEPRGLGKLNETATYWYKRRVEFEDGITNCRATADLDEKLSCYQQLKVKQYQLNSDYNARIEAMEQQRMGPQEMFDRTDTMIPVGGYLNNFTRFQPNEFR